MNETLSSKSSKSQNLGCSEEQKARLEFELVCCRASRGLRIVANQLVGTRAKNQSGLQDRNDLSDRNDLTAPNGPAKKEKELQDHRESALVPPSERSIGCHKKKKAAT